MIFVFILKKDMRKIFLLFTILFLSGCADYVVTTTPNRGYYLNYRYNYPYNYQHFYYNYPNYWNHNYCPPNHFRERNYEYYGPRNPRRR